MAQLESQLHDLRLDRDDLSQQLQQSHMLLRLLQSSLTSKIRGRDALIAQLFDAAAGGAGEASDAVIESLRSRYAKLARQTAGLDDDVANSVGANEEEEEGAAGGHHAVAMKAELAGLRGENQRLQQAIALLQYRRLGELSAAAAATVQDRSPSSTMPARLQRVASSCAALSEDFGRVREAVRQELEASVGDVMRKAQAGLLKYARAHEGDAGQLRRLYKAEQAERRRLFNLVQELRGNIRVLIRPRPPTATADGQGGEELCMRLVPEAGEVRLAYGRKQKQFEYDHVFGLEATQEEVYQQVAPIVGSVLDGFNVSELYRMGGL